MFEGLYFSTVYDGCRQQSLSRCSDHVFSQDAEVKRFRKLGQYIHNIIVVTRLFVEISNYILPILVLLKIINSPENYRITLKNTSS